MTPAPGTVVAIIDAYDDVSAESDLAWYRSTFNLPPCTTENGCFSKIGQNTSDPSALPNPSQPRDDWSPETALDLDAVSAICPACRLLLVEANSDHITGSTNDLVAAVQQAITQGANYISMSWGEFDLDAGATEHSYDTDYFQKSGVTFVAAAGDSGYFGYDTGCNTATCFSSYFQGVPYIRVGREYFINSSLYPAVSPNVVGVGGVSLAKTNTILTATAWGGSDLQSSSGWAGAESGCSSTESAPSYQSAVSTISSLCDGMRASADLSADADPNSGIAVYNAGHWLQEGGTSLAAPIIAVMYALTQEQVGSAGGAVQSYAYTHQGGFADVTSGSATGSCGTALCNAGTCWDGPTGIGMPASPTALYSSSAPSSTSCATAGWQLPAPQLTDVASLADQPATDTSATSSSSASSAPIPSSSSPSSPSPSPSPTVTVQNPGGTVAAITDYTGTTVRLSTTAIASDGGAISYRSFGLPAGTALGATGLITGKPARAGIYPVTVTATDGSATGSASFTWTVKQNGFVPNVAPKIVGTLKRGKTVKVNVTSWKSAAGAAVKPVVGYQWYLNGKPIRSATKSRFTIPKSSSYKKHRLTLKITIKAVTYYKVYSDTTARTAAIP